MHLFSPTSVRHNFFGSKSFKINFKYSSIIS